MSDKPPEAKVIQLITVKDDGILSITMEAINYLSTIPTKRIAVLSIMGPLRSGKSSLMNAFVNSDSAFNENTKGLHIYTKEIELNNKVTLLLIDSQGLSMHDNVSNKLFILNMLLGSCVIYNICGMIDEEMIEEFAQYCDAVNKICVDSGNGGNLCEYLPEVIWVMRDVEYEGVVCDELEEQLKGSSKGDYIRKLFTKRRCMCLPNVSSGEFAVKVKEVYDNVKKSISCKAINQIELDGNELFGVLQNYLDVLNNDEYPVISQALENVLLSKANSISDKHFDIFKNELKNAFDSKYPLNTNDIYKKYFELQYKQTELFCKDIERTLTVPQCGTYLSKLCNKMKNELEFIFDNNKEYYDQWFNIEYKELQKNISSQTLDTLTNVKQFFNEYSTHLQTALSKLMDIPNYDSSLSIISTINKILNECVIDKISKYGDIISQMHVNSVNVYERKIDEMNSDMKQLNDNINADRKTIEMLNTEKRDLSKKLLEIETKIEKMNSELKVKEKEAANSLLMENKKCKQIEEYYQTQLKEKESIIYQHQSTIDKLTKELTDLKKDITSKSNELHKENMKLNSELAKMKETQSNIEQTNITNNQQYLHLQTIFKNIQTTFNEFEENINKFDKETQILFKTKHIDYNSDIKNKLRTWIDEIKSYNENQLKTITDINESKLKELNDKLDEMKWNFDKNEYTLKEQINLTDTYKRKLEVVNKELEDTKEIANAKNELIDKQKETITMLEERVAGLEKENGDLEVNLNKNVFNYKMKEDEIETLVMVFGGILSRRKDKYEHNMKRLSAEPKRAIEELVRQYKLFK